MIELSELLNSLDFTKNLITSLPCALLVVDEAGRVLDINNASERLFGSDSPNSKSNMNSGSVLNCLDAYERPTGCGSQEGCSQCKIRNLALQSIMKNTSLESTAQFSFVSDGQVRDTLLSLSAFPFTHNDRKLCYLILENLRSDVYHREDESHFGFHGIIGQNEKMVNLFDTIRQIRSSSDPVLIQGESGTGKELVALAIHRESKRSGKHFVPVNCGALPEGLLESEMFGHVKGAFTGATFEKKGRFRIADQGTIFLDEVSELNLSMQAKFLRIIESGTFEPVGSDRSISVNVRVISATNRLLEEEMDKGRFRSDLYYRLCVIPIMVPSLRDRRDDIALLTDFFLEKITRQNDQKKKHLSAKAISILENHDWPGNVRELQNTLKYAVLKCHGETITPEHFPYYLFQKNFTHGVRRYRKSKLEIASVADALRKSNGNKRLAAERLGVSRSTLYRFFDRHRSETG